MNREWKRNLRSKFMWGHVWNMTFDHWTKGSFKMSKYFNDPNFYEIRDKETAEYFGFEWIGRPYLIYPIQNYDWLDHLIEWCSAFAYIMSGQMTEDTCRDADERLLSYAR